LSSTVMSSTNDKIRITYWGFGGRTASSRLALLYGGVPFDFEAVPYDKWEEWQTDRKRFPTADIPVLTLGDRVLTDSFSIYYFCGQTSGLWPSDPFLGARCVEIMAMTQEIYTGYFGTCLFRTLAVPSVNPDLTEEKAAELRDGPYQEHFRFYMRRVNEIIEANTNKSYTAGDSLTIADLHVWHLCTFNSEKPWLQEKEFEAVRRIKEMVDAIDKGEEFAKARTEFA
jgi:glutathione S-transferase